MNCHTKIAEEKKRTYLKQMLELTLFIKTKELKSHKKINIHYVGVFLLYWFSRIRWQVYFRSNTFKKTKGFKYKCVSQTQCTC